MFDIKKQNWINGEIRVLLDLIKKGTINRGISQKAKEQRLSQEIETYTNIKIIEAFENNKIKFTYLKNIKGNSGSTKSPYELLLIFNFGNEEDVFVDLKPINILKKSSSPFMGTIAKYIKRYNDSKYYDLFFIVKYESEVDKLPILRDIDYHFVKDINNYSLYNNWQLQICIQNIKISYGKDPLIWKEQLLSLLKKFEESGIEKIQKRINKLKHKLLNSKN